VVGSSDVRFKEESAGIGVGPVFGDGIFGGFLEDFDDAFEVLVFADKLEGGTGADAFYGVEVIAA
jgi:hypothetical protein